MIYLKSDLEIALIKESAQVLGKAHAEVAKIIRPGITTKELDKVADEYIQDMGGYPSFKGYKVDKFIFPAALCISVNEVVVHGLPGNYFLKEGDIVSVDCGVFYKGFHSDSAYTYAVGEVKPEIAKLLLKTKESLYEGIKMAIHGYRIGDIGYAIQNHVEKERYTVVRELVGHGVGKKLHEKPDVPNYGKRGQGSKLQEGMVLAIEPMINMGKKDIISERDNWTIRTKDRMPSAHFEHTIAVRKGQAEVLTTFQYIEEVLSESNLVLA
jgi:methionyl aminopeptidase